MWNTTVVVYFMFMIDAHLLTPAGTAIYIYGEVL